MPTAWILSFVLANFSVAADDCLEWFKQLKVVAGSRDCVINCGTAPVDMGSFDCPLRCDEFCRSKPGTICLPKNSWIRKIKTGRPPKWLVSAETASELSAQERTQLVNSVGQLSDNFPIDSLTGIYILDRPRSFFSLGSPSAYYSGQIVFYKSAFREPSNLRRLLVHELAHHLHETSERKLFDGFKAQLGKSEAPEEEFAKYFENIVLQDKDQADPIIVKWLKSKIAGKYFLKGCAK